MRRQHAHPAQRSRWLRIDEVVAFTLVAATALYMLAHVLASSVICPPPADAAWPSPRPSPRIIPGPTARSTPIVVGFPPATPRPAITPPATDSD